tara:strand:+ start:1018 stop:1890 length:873 start_codon:yes stop_codon:yes gene_type:complete
MIYKFIDNNGSEISVNSLESLQALVDSDTINESTKVKAGLRGKWTTASEIEGLNFTSDEEIQNTPEPEEDIKSFITQSENSTPQEEIKEESKTKTQDDDKYKHVEEIVEKKVKMGEKFKEKEDTGDNSDYYTENFVKQNDQEEDNMGLNLPEAVKICFKKYFDFKGRASRSEYWYFVLFVVIGYAIGFGLIFIAEQLFWLLAIFIIAIIIPWISVGVRRLHDINKSGWLIALPLPAGVIEVIFSLNRQTTLEIIFAIIGFCCSIYLLILYCSAGDNKQNRFGKNPLKTKR